MNANDAVLTLLQAFTRSRSTDGMDAPALSDEFLKTFTWDQQLRAKLFHGVSDLSPEIRKKLRYHVEKNGAHELDVIKKLRAQGSAGITEIEKLYGLGDPTLLYHLGNVHLVLIPKTAKRELTRLLASEDLEDSHRPDLVAMLGAVEERLADGSWA